MIILQTLPPPTSNVWYLAYGSNLAASKFIHDRGIVPISSTVVEVSGWTLVMDSAGVPYSEPCFGSISPIPAFGDEKCVTLIGTAYLLTPEMYKTVLASEGGGIAYCEVEIRVKKLEGKSPTFAARSLATVLRRLAKPSERYMGLLRTGANEADMPHSYQKFLKNILTYTPPTAAMPRLGAAIFLAFWIPVMSVMEKITKSSLKRSGEAEAPTWVVLMVRVVVHSMWLYHDYVHSPIWGRGDGMELC
ncbi:unnamed protein product [Periconia digitata]|uniref:gamma-glutamylcyclotransferase n=1 Tax=Periconia digitata TaxID=1303443 RepID=A0A9W4UFY2_9PLEO|nr:unnamed protein product [Periconia digitata]